MSLQYFAHVDPDGTVDVRVYGNVDAVKRLGVPSPYTGRVAGVTYDWNTGQFSEPIQPSTDHFLPEIDA